MNNFVIFVVGIAVTIISGMGIITSQVFIAYRKNETNDVFVKSELVKNI